MIRRTPLRRVSEKRLAAIKSGEYKRPIRKPIRKISAEQARKWKICRDRTIKFYDGKSVLSGKICKNPVIHHWNFTRVQSPKDKFNLNNLVLLDWDEHYHTGADENFYKIKEKIIKLYSNGIIKLQEEERII